MSFIATKRNANHTMQAINFSWYLLVGVPTNVQAHAEIKFKSACLY